MNREDQNLNPHYDDLYFSESDGMDESLYVFIEGNNLTERLPDLEQITVGETGFGTGLNFLTLLNQVGRERKKPLRLTYLCLEKYPLTGERITALLAPFRNRLKDLMPLYEKYWTAFYEKLTPGWNRADWSFPGAEVHFELYFGDGKDWAKEQGKPCVNAWFLDGHSPEKNPDIWAPEIMEAVFARTALEGTLASFTSAGIVKRALRGAGFFIKRKKGFGKKRHMIQGYRPLEEREGL
ncbi:MAG: tRNA (5-methylaminomethyl-2-thiouridine)(34)-methyltransferase MnmD [Spirochaetales bacterium]|nr:tRNA (5-methylaminomethyl-2-thiouridine)(34)-methyltransferase MnmD [Spirochaetales bacterium]